jgi:hypothetical protein
MTVSYGHVLLNFVKDLNGAGDSLEGERRVLGEIEPGKFDSLRTACSQKMYLRAPKIFGLLEILLFPTVYHLRVGRRGGARQLSLVAARLDRGSDRGVDPCDHHHAQAHQRIEELRHGETSNIE